MVYKPPAGSQPIIFTDLDGTLLDHDTYSYAAASPALAEISARGFPLVLVSSKTRAELLALQRKLDLHTPFISENGAAVYWREAGQLQQKAFARPLAEWLPALHQLREQEGYAFTGFSDGDAEAIAHITGLGPDAARLAGQREFTEPLLWQGDNRHLTSFHSALYRLGLRAVQGGRFLSVMGDFDKGITMAWLRDKLQRQLATSLVTIALGDSPNDAGMLAAADVAVVIRSARSDCLHPEGPEWIIRTEQAGPLGWQSAMEKILALF